MMEKKIFIKKIFLICLILIFLILSFVGGVIADETNEVDKLKDKSADDIITYINNLNDENKESFNTAWETAIDVARRKMIIGIEEKDTDGKVRGKLWDVLTEKNKGKAINSLENDNQVSSFLTAAAKNEAKKQGIVLSKDFKINLKKEGLEYNNEKEQFEYKLDGERIRTLKIDDLPLDTSKTKLPGLKEITYTNKNGFFYDFGTNSDKRREIVCEQGRINSKGEIVDRSRINNEKVIKISGFNDNPANHQIVQIGEISNGIIGIHMFGKQGLKVSINDIDFKVHDEDNTMGIGYGFVNPVDNGVYHMRGMFEDKTLKISGEIPLSKKGLLVFGDSEIPKSIEGIKGGYEFLRIKDNGKIAEISGNIEHASVYVQDKNKQIKVESKIGGGIVIKDSKSPYFDIGGDGWDGMGKEKWAEKISVDRLSNSESENGRVKSNNEAIKSEDIKKILETETKQLSKEKQKDNSIKDLLEEATHRYINQRRGRELNWDDRIAEIARQHSVVMANRGRIGHDGFGQRASQIGGGVGAENVAMFGSFQKLSNEEVGKRFSSMWMNSAGHKQNIMNMGWTKTGVGISVKIRGNMYEYYATQLFSR